MMTPSSTFEKWRTLTSERSLKIFSSKWKRYRPFLAVGFRLSSRSTFVEKQELLEVFCTVLVSLEFLRCYSLVMLQ